MPLDGLVLIMISPVGLLLVIGAIGGSILLYRALCPDTVSRFGLGRLFDGYAVALLGLLAYSFVVAFQMLEARNFPDHDMTYSVLAGWTLSLFAIHVFVALLLLPTIGVPILLFANKRGWASLATVVFVTGMTVFVLLWESEGRSLPFFKRPSIAEQLLSFLEVFAPFGIVAIAFSLAGRLPIFPRWARSRGNA